MAGFSVLIYDQFLTISEEVEFIWNRPKNLISWTFLLNRYFTPIILAIDAYDKLGFVKSLTSTVRTTLLMLVHDTDSARLVVGSFRNL